MGKSFDDWFNGREPEPEPKAKEPEKFYDYDAELPAGVDFADEPGRYIFLCRGCDKWKPMDWELSEDSHESHWCGGSPYCCPLKDKLAAQKAKRGVPPKGDPRIAHPTALDINCPGCGAFVKGTNSHHHRVTGAAFCGGQICYTKMLTAHNALRIPPAPPMPSALEKQATHFQCLGCHQWYPIRQAHYLPGGGIVCGSYGCVPPERITPKEPSALEKAHRHPMAPTPEMAKKAYEDILRNTAVCDGCNKRIPLEKASHHPYSHRPYCGHNDCYHKIAKTVMMAQAYGAPPPRAG